MKRYLPPPLDLHEEVTELIATLHATEQRLEELTAGEVDTVADEVGRTLLLRRSQEHLRRTEADKQAAIFAAFTQADGSTTRRFGGTGLGLTISSQLIGMMGGRIWVEPNPGGGAVFQFTLQRADGAEEDASHER